MVGEDGIMQARAATLGAWNGRLRIAAGVAAYVALYTALDWISLIDPLSPLGITPWNPPAGLSFALLLRYGMRFAPAVFAAVVVADLLFRDLAGAPWVAPATALVVALGYGTAAVILRGRMRISLRLDSQLDLRSLLWVALAAAGIVAPAVVALFCAAGLLNWADFPAIALRFWVGDVIGIAVFAPFLLLFSERRRWPAAVRTRNLVEYGLQLAAIGLGLWIIFGLESANHFEFSYVLFLPLIWIALRDGLVGAAWGIVATQVGLIVAIQVKSFDAGTVMQFQLLMLAVAVTGIFLGAAVDERQRAESALRDSETRLQTIVSTAPDAILTVDESGRITSANRAAAQMFGGGMRNFVGSELARLLPDIDLEGPARRSSVETSVRRFDGSTFTAEASIGTAESAGRKLYVAVVRDISERKRAEAALQEHQVQLAHAARLTAAGEMAAGLAHELNQPLTAAIGFARACEEVLKAAPDRAEAARREAQALIEQAVQQAMRAGEIIRRTREFLRRGDMRPVRIEAAEIFKLSLDLVRTEAALGSVEVSMHVAGKLPPLFVDPIQIEQVILNLMRNSMEEMSRAGVAAPRVVLAAMPHADDPQLVEISVRDSGPGFPPEIADRLFTPFATTKEGGMGLGLSISRSIIEAHAGTIRAVPHPPGGGAEVRFTVPAYVEPADDA